MRHVARRDLHETADPVTVGVECSATPLTVERQAKS
jgi:hypothetical protein